ncbi:MAG TPA: flagella basal body P-ring formation protein FlgA [Spirochaetia bacterium]|nr:flagella basal body P-ring formation protein FlgA [Spirochaetia bacterium]
MRAAVRLIPVLCAAFLLGAGAQATAAGGTVGTTLYVNRVVVAPSGNVSLGALVHSPGPVSAPAQEALSHSATVLGDSLQYLPASRYQSQLEAVFGTDAILVGSWSLLVPQGTSAEGEGYLLARLADYLIAQNLFSDSRVDFSFTLGSLRGNPPQDGAPVFQTVRTAQAVEVSFTLTGSDGSSVSGRVSLPAAASGPSAAPDPGTAVRSSSAVRVLFRRGPITVEMPGKALSSASVGDTVSVLVPDSQKTFTGRLVEGKAVQVDLP